MFHSLADVILAKNFVKICQNQWNNMKKALNDERDIMIWCLTYINTLAKLQETSGKNTNWKKTHNDLNTHNYACNIWKKNR